MKTAFLSFLLMFLGGNIVSIDSIPRPAVSAPADSLTRPATVSSVDRLEAMLAADTLPQFPGGWKDGLSYFCRLELHRPEYMPICVHGVPRFPVVRFTVDEEGQVHNPQTIRPIDPILDSLARMHVREESPRWKPALRDGRPVVSTRLLPIRFEDYYIPSQGEIDHVIVADTLPASSLVALRGKVLSRLTPMPGVTVRDSLHPERITTTDERGNFTLTTSPECLLVLTVPDGRRRLVRILHPHKWQRQYIIFQW